MARKIAVSEVAKAGRLLRRPKHPYQIKQRPFIVQPIMIAPVLPGETLKHLSFQSRAVTDPIKNPLCGWWNETMFFYVKVTDLYERDLLTEMFLNPEADLTSLDSATAVDYYHENTSSGTDINWTWLCLKRIIDCYFRSPDDDHTTGKLTGSGGTTNMPMARYVHQSYLDSFINDADYVTPADEELLDISAGTAGGGDDKLMVSEIEEARKRYNLALMGNLTELTFEEYCAQYYNASVPAVAANEPELLHHTREWQYPSNTIDPSNGTPRSAVSWVIKGSEDKQYFFKHPGFIVGINVVRPKVYFGNLSSSAAMLLKTAQAWFAPQLADDPFASMVKVAAGDAPVTSNTDAYWVDMKDLLLYGDQFVNFANTETDANLHAVPRATGGWQYPLTADVDSLFVSASPANQVWTDGLVNLTILGRQTDTSPMMIGHVGDNL